MISVVVLAVVGKGVGIVVVDKDVVNVVANYVLVYEIYVVILDVVADGGFNNNRFSY